MTIRKLLPVSRSNLLYALGGLLLGLAISLGFHSHPAGRFVAEGGDGFFVLDSETGKLCLSYEPQGGTGKLPLCYDLYKGIATGR